MKNETNSSVDRKRRRKDIALKTGVCSHCKPHSGENNKHHKHGPKKPRYKDKQ